MFFEENTTPNTGTPKKTQDMLAYADSIKLADLGMKSFGETLKNAMSPESAIKMKLALEELTTTMVRETMGQTKVISEGLEQTIAKATFETSLFGITADDNLQLIKEINDEMQVTTLLTAEQVTNIQLLSRSMGVASKDTATMVRGFRDIGVGTDQAIENINMMSKQARAYGINVGQFMGKISENIKRLSSYNFKDGIEGFTRMVAKAQSLRIDVSKTFSLAEGLMDPEKAIEMAAGFQMVGGAVGALGDPFKLLNMAQNDVAGLQDELLKASESAVSFNEETGEFDIAVTEMYRLREIAKMTGKSYEEVADEAIKTKQRTEKLRILENSVGGFSDEQKELISNFGQIVKDGRGGVDLKVQIPGMKELVDAEDLTPDQLKKLEELQKDNAKTEIDISKEIRDLNKEQLSVLKAREGLDNQASTVSMLLSTETPAIGDLQEVFRNATVATSESINDTFNDIDVSNLGMTLSNAIEKGFSSPEANLALKDAFSNIRQNLSNEIKTLPAEVKKSLEDTDNIFKDSNPLEKVGGILKKFVGDTTSLDVDSLESTLKEYFGVLNNTIDGYSEFLERRTYQRTGQRSNMDNQDVYRPENITNPNNETEQPIINNIEIPETTLQPISDNNNLNQNNTVITTPTETIREVSEGKMTVDGNIQLTIPNMGNVQIAQVVPELLKNPEFISGVKKVLEGRTNTYSV